MASSFLPAIVLKARGKQATSPAGKCVAGLASVTVTQVDIYLDSAWAPSLSSPFLCGLLAGTQGPATVLTQLRRNARSWLTYSGDSLQ